MKTLKITISLPPPSLNVLLNMHYRDRVKLKKRIRREVWVQVVAQERRHPLLFPVTISGTRWGKQRLDPDNLIGSLKPVIDALRWAMVIDDDTEKHVSIGAIKQRKLPKGQVARLELTIKRRES